MFRFEYSIPKLCTKRPTEKQLELLVELEHLHSFYIPEELKQNRLFVEDVLNAYAYNKDLPEGERKQSGFRRIKKAKDHYYWGGEPRDKEEAVIVSINQRFGFTQWIQEDIDADPDSLELAAFERYEQEGSHSCL